LQDGPRGLRTLGVVTGALMAFGLASAPGILLRLDDMATAPAWVWIGFVGWFGTFLVYPAWAIWLSAVEARQANRGRLRPGVRMAVGRNL
jgi:hypothetical protein